MSDVTPETPDATPAAVAAAGTAGVDLTTVEGTGVAGRVLVGDVTGSVAGATAPPPAKPVAQNDYTGLTLEAHRNPEQGVWQFGVNLSGAFVVIATRKLGGVDDDIREAIQPGFRAARAAG